MVFLWVTYKRVLARSLGFTGLTSGGEQPDNTVTKLRASDGANLGHTKWVAVPITWGSAKSVGWRIQITATKLRLVTGLTSALCRGKGPFGLTPMEREWFHNSSAKS